MKIYGTDPLGKLKELIDRTEQGEKGGKTGEARGATAAAQTAAASGTDSVELSPEVKELSSLREALFDTPEIRQELVDRLKSEIASGRYRVDGSRVAESLIEEQIAFVTDTDGDAGDA